MRIVAAAVLMAIFGVAASGHAQPYPSKHIQLLVGYAAGGTGDIVARLVGNRLAAVLGQNIVVENRAGASGTIAAQALVNAAPDGHT